MYTKDLGVKMTLRLTNELDAFVKEMATIYNISPSEYIRQTLQQVKFGNDIGNKLLQEGYEDQIKGLLGINNLGGLDNGIDRKTNISNQLQYERISKTKA